MDDLTRLQRWLSRHPLKAPGVDRAAYTAEVMRRVNALAAAARPASAAAWMPRWLPVPALVLGAVALALVLGRTPTAPAPTAQTILNASQQLAALDDSYDALMEDAHGHGVLANGWEELDGMMLAEAASEDSSWLEELSQTLDELDEENVSDAPEGSSEEDWWKELETLESEDSSASS